MKGWLQACLVLCMLKWPEYDYVISHRSRPVSSWSEWQQKREAIKYTILFLLCMMSGYNCWSGMQIAHPDVYLSFHFLIPQVTPCREFGVGWSHGMQLWAEESSRNIENYVHLHGLNLMHAFTLDQRSPGLQSADHGVCSWRTWFAGWLRLQGTAGLPPTSFKGSLCMVVLQGSSALVRHNCMGSPPTLNHFLSILCCTSLWHVIK